MPEAKYAVLPWDRQGRNRLNLAWRAIKMLVPRCDECQKTGMPQWWEKCQHNPYTANVRTDVVTPVIKCNVCGEELPEGTFTHCGGQDFVQEGEKTKPSFRPAPNLREVRMGAESNGGQSLGLARAKGWLPVHEKGIAPMCEFSRCYEPLTDETGKPRRGAVKTNYGNYCCEEEAKLVALQEGDEAIEVFNNAKRRSQLEGISLTRL
jgi:hypothetical protein